MRGAAKLDHLISTEDGKCVITNMCVLYDTILSDHIPVMVEIHLELAPDVEHGSSNDVRCKIDWYFMSMVYKQNTF